MRTLRVLHANRLAVILGSGLLCLLGFVAGCDSGSSSSGLATPTAEDKAKQESIGKARMEAFGKTGVHSGIQGKASRVKRRS